MGNAQQAPLEGYTQRFAVMDHAVQRFRERAEGFLRENSLLGDEAVRQKLDAEVCQVLDAGGGHAITDNGEPAQLVHLEQPAWGSMWALIKENHHRRFPQKQAIVTCLTDWMVAQSIIDGRYSGNVPHVPRFARVIEQRMAHGPDAGSTERAPQLTPAVGTPAVSPVPRPEEQRLVVHEGPEGPQYTPLPREAVAAHIEGLLHQGVPLSAIRVWRPAGARVRLEFD
ncbi:MAG: hypothetical protein L0Y66_09535 [Myxococcaceae bacterium]|nr:hypothetical protein [Myxococcaceae bacterium]MCI0669049.1 hypothetical protein [Myxococcaceae bacterium]